MVETSIAVTSFQFCRVCCIMENQRNQSWQVGLPYRVLARVRSTFTTPYSSTSLTDLEYFTMIAEWRF